MQDKLCAETKMPTGLSEKMQSRRCMTRREATVNWCCRAMFRTTHFVASKLRTEVVLSKTL